MINRKSLLVLSILYLLLLLNFSVFAQANKKEVLPKENVQIESSKSTSLSYEKLFDLKKEMLFSKLQSSQSFGKLAFENTWGLRVLLLIFLASIIGVTISSLDKFRPFLNKPRKCVLFIIFAIIVFVFAAYDAQQGSLYDTAEFRADSTATLISSLDSLNYTELMAIQPYWVDSTREELGCGGRWESRLSQFYKKLDYQLFYLIVLLLLSVIIIINWEEEY